MIHSLFWIVAFLAIAARSITGSSVVLNVIGGVCLVAGIVAGGFWLPALRGLDWRGRPIDGRAEDA